MSVHPQSQRIDHGISTTSERPLLLKQQDLGMKEVPPVFCLASNQSVTNDLIIIKKKDKQILNTKKAKQLIHVSWDAMDVT